MSETQDIFEYAALLSKTNVLPTLVAVCKDPGYVRNHYAKQTRSSFYAVDTLLRLELIYEDKSGDRALLYPTEYGKSLYTGIWYSVGKGALVPMLQSHHMLVPFEFTDSDEYILSGKGDGAYTLTNITKDERLDIEDVFIDTDGDMWFSVDGYHGRFMIDAEEDIDTTDKGTQECLREIVAVSKVKQAEKMRRTYESLVDFLDEGELI